MQKNLSSVERNSSRKKSSATGELQTYYHTVSSLSPSRAGTLVGSLSERYSEEMAGCRRLHRKTTPGLRRKPRFLFCSSLLCCKSARLASSSRPRSLVLEKIRFGLVSVLVHRTACDRETRRNKPLKNGKLDGTARVASGFFLQNEVEKISTGIVQF